MNYTSHTSTIRTSRLTVYTIGHSNHETDTLLSMMRQHGIQLVIDVRSSPYSRYVPHANREILSHDLHAMGLGYRWMGDALGGKPQGIVADYDQIQTEPAFQQGIAELVTLAEEQIIVLLCAEGDYKQCHRYKLITPVLNRLGVRVLHIRPDNSVVDDEKVPRQLSLF